MKARSTRELKEELEKFELFLFEMDDALDRFEAQARQAGVVLDYSVESLDQLETFLQLQPGKGDELIKNQAARYLGEVVRKNLGGRWELCVKDPKYLYYQLPVISGYSESGIEFCPVEVIANFLHSRKRGLLRGAVESHAAFKTT